MSKYYMLRFIASVTDYLIILVYLVLFYLLIKLLNPVFHIQQHYENYYLFRHFISFSFVTLPVVLYFILMEISVYKSTIGKRIWGLTVNTETKNRKNSIIKRNVSKFLPWEAAHCAIHLNPGFENVNSFSGNFSLFLLILSQIIVFIYFISIIVNKNSQSIYDVFAGTIVQPHEK